MVSGQFTEFWQSVNSNLVKSKLSHKPRKSDALILVLSHGSKIASFSPSQKNQENRPRFSLVDQTIGCVVF